MKYPQDVEAIRKSFILSSYSWRQAKAKADRLKLTVSEYLSLLIEEDQEPPRKHPLSFPAPLTPAAEARYDRASAEAEEAYKQGKRKPCHTVAALMAQLNA